MSTSHKEKIIRVLQLFQTTDEKTPMNAVQISQKLEEEYGMENVHRTSIYDDVRLLQSCGYPIKQAENSHKGWYMEKYLLEDWEIKLMLDSVQQARCVSVHEANEIRNKLLNLTSQRGQSRFSHMIMPLPGNVRDVGQIGEYIEIMLEAMYLHKKIQFQYTEINNARNVNACGVFEDGSYIYTTEKISEEIPNVNFRLTYLGEQELGVLEHKKVYSELIKHWIIQKLRTVKIQKNSKEYYKYACRSNVTSRWIQTEQGFQTFYSGNRQISLERKYNFTVKILDDGRAYLKIDTSSVFLSNQTVYDYITQGMNPIGMEVKNEWGKNNQTGILTEICDYTVVDKIDFADSLKAYYTDMKKEGYRVENLPDQTPVVRVELQAGKIYPYYPQALKPVLTREKVGQIDARFSMTIEKYIKRDMITRIELDKDFIRDIGSIAQLGDLEFENDMCNVKELGYLKGKVESPALTCGQGKRLRCGEEFKVFNYGFYQKPDEKIKIGYIYPKNTVDLIKAVVNGICEFAAYGKYQGEKDAYIIPGLLDIQMKPMIKEEYELGDITDYKRAAQRLRKVEGIDIVIGIVPDGMDEDGPYNPFKTIWAEANIPSQMISMKTAQLFYRGKREGNKSKYYLHNIVLGILGKTGGIPWVIKEMPGNVDCFVGLDVATLEKGIHYPACSVVFDKSGRLLGFYKPKSAQRGEKIETRILQDIFDQVLLSYEEKFGEQPKNIMIHRDGFSNENDAWYEKYFGAKGIAYTIVEVRKNISSKLAIIEDGVIKNPEMGYCIYNNNKGYLVTTNMKNKKGSPNPLLLEKKCGDVPMTIILKQVLYLSQLHVGSTQKMRLPITTGYADKICKNREFVPEGKMDNRLFFL